MVDGFVSLHMCSPQHPQEPNLLPVARSADGHLRKDVKIHLTKAESKLFATLLQVWCVLRLKNTELRWLTRISRRLLFFLVCEKDPYVVMSAEK